MHARVIVETFAPGSCFYLKTVLLPPTAWLLTVKEPQGWENCRAGLHGSDVAQQLRFFHRLALISQREASLFSPPQQQSWESEQTFFIKVLTTISQRIVSLGVSAASVTKAVPGFEWNIYFLFTCGQMTTF